MTYITNTPSTQKSSFNSTSTPLTIGQTFVGTGELSTAPSVMVSVATDQNGVFYAEFSQDNVNWETSLSFEYQTDRINPPHIFEKGYRYFRVRFENNSGVNQTFLRITTSFGSFQKLTSPINGSLSDNFDATVVRPTKYEYEVAMGKRQGRSSVSKFGFNKDIDAVSPEIIASFGGGDYIPSTQIIKNPQTFTITYNNATDGLGTTGALQVLIQYLDADFNLAEATHVLGGTGSDVTAFTGLGINRVILTNSGSLGYNVNNITFTATTDATIQAQIPPEASITQQCLYHIPKNHKLLLDWVNINALKISGGGASPRVSVKGFCWNRDNEIRYKVLETEIDTEVENTVSFNTPQPIVFSEREVVYLSAATDQNNTAISARFSGILERIV